MRSRDKREYGVLLHISSLPSAYGIGSLGAAAYEFVDFLAKSGGKYWQILPLVPLGEGNSPYKSSSCFAGEPLLIDLDLLVKDGLLENDELPEEDFCSAVDYKRLRKTKTPALYLAAARFDTDNTKYREFLEKNDWIDDYAVFVTAMEKFKLKSILDLPSGIKYRDEQCLKEFYEENQTQIERQKILQFLFFSQYNALREYANGKGIKIIGDIPFYVSHDSAEVWSNRQEFRLGKDFTPLRVAGVPPDIFSKEGQLWGNPIYDWDYQKKTGFSWWKKRLKYCAELYDVIRIDHFRAFESFYSIPFGAKNAKTGNWEKGPAMNFWRSVEIKGMDIIAEDLGGDEPEVEKLVRDTGFPNMKVLQFGFSTDLQNKFLPQNYNKNCVCYTGTHDNNTVLGWYNSADTSERLLFSRLAPEPELSPCQRMICMAMESRAKLVIVPMQDWLQLDERARMNTPGTKHGNWSWRMNKDALTEGLQKTMKKICRERI